MPCPASVWLIAKAIGWTMVGSVCVTALVLWCWPKKDDAVEKAKQDLKKGKLVWLYPK